LKESNHQVGNFIVDSIIHNGRIVIWWLRCIARSPLTLNVLGGILASLVFSFCVWVRKRLSGWRFKQVFGKKGAEEGISLVYEELELHNKIESHPYSKPGSAEPFRLSISRPIPVASVRAVGYLATAIGKFTGKPPSVRSDLETRTAMDLDFVCFGGPTSNVMTATCQENPGNRLAVLDQENNQFFRLSDGAPLHQLDSRFDYGLILKLHPVQFPERVWIACVGVGERGTSGAAWFLANKWKTIRKRAKRRPFAALIRVERDVLNGRDQSAELVEFLV
jgi:hypothetical protein